MPLDKKQQRRLDDLKRKQHSLTQQIAAARKNAEGERHDRTLDDDLRRVEQQIDDLLDGADEY